MTDWNPAEPERVLDDAWAALQNEQRKLGGLSKHLQEASTVVRAKDHSLEMTFNGQGEPVKLVFNTSKYRTMPPAQLAKVIIDTVRQGRAESQDKIAELMGSSGVPGLDLDGFAKGEVSPDEMVNALISPMFAKLNEFGIDVKRPPKVNGAS